VIADIVELPKRRRNSANFKPLTSLKVKNYKSGFLSDVLLYKGLRAGLESNKRVFIFSTMIEWYLSGRVKMIVIGAEIVKIPICPRE
jgi:hypothetical protein